jgi:hypothetical protein
VACATRIPFVARVESRECRDPNPVGCEWNPVAPRVESRRPASRIPCLRESNPMAPRLESRRPSECSQEARLESRDSQIGCNRLNERALAVRHDENGLKGWRATRIPWGANGIPSPRREDGDARYTTDAHHIGDGIDLPARQKADVLQHLKRDLKLPPKVTMALCSSPSDLIQ